MTPTRLRRGRLAGLRGGLVLALLVGAFAVAQGTASAAPPQPSLSVTCSVGGLTTASWAHSRVSSLQVLWYNALTTVRVEHPVVSKGGPNGMLSMPTPDGATRVHVDFYTDTTENSIDVACT